MQARYSRIRELGAEVIAVTMSQPHVLKRYLERVGWSFPVLTDPERTHYRRFGLERTPLRRFFRGRVLIGYLKLVAKGWRPRLPYRDEDVYQSGGDFILDEEQRLIYAYRSHDPTDRPPVAELLRVLERPR